MNAEQTGSDDGRLDEALTALAKAEKAQEAPPHVQVEIMRQWESVRAREPRRHGSSASGRAMLAAAAALVLAVASGGWWLKRQSDGQSRRSSDTAMVLQSPSPSYETVTWLEPDADSLQIVRLRVASATLKAQGYAISDPTGIGTVEIEMIVGLDGMARSIRVNSAAIPTY